MRRLARENPDRIVSESPGVVIVQIDGLAQPILAHQIRAGRVPFISNWVRSGEMKLDSWVALLPSQTSASQAGILHGNNSFIPAFRWWEKDSQRMLVSNHPADATEIVTRASNGEGLLSNDGASVGNLVTGDAVRSYITMATINDPKQGLGQSRAWYSFFVSPDNYLRSAVLARWRGDQGVRPGVALQPARRRAVDAPRHALPHRARGDERAASLALHVARDGGDVPRNADRSTSTSPTTTRSPITRARSAARRSTRSTASTPRSGSLVKAAEDAPRPYKFILLSDHGQSLGATFKQRYGETLEEVIARLMGGATDVAAATGRVEEWGPINAVATEASRASGTTGAMTRVALRNRTEAGAIDLAPDRESTTGADGDGKKASAEPPELVVCASGNLALIYFPRLAGRVSLEEMDELWPGLVAALVDHPGIGLLMGRSEERGAMVMGKTGIHYLGDGSVTGEDPMLPFGPYAEVGHAPRRRHGQSAPTSWRSACSTRRPTRSPRSRS